MLKHWMAALAITSLYSSACFADSSKELDRLAAIAADYSRCARVVLANFESDEESRKVSKLFFRETIKNIRKMVDLELAAGDVNIVYNVDVMGRDVLVGYLLKGFASESDDEKSTAKKLNEENNWDWKKTNKKLWSQYGCSTIYESLLHSVNSSK
ncbi:hypothetical protein [Pseudomonas sp. AP3_22 TE3818]